jgi:four helix bundle protein
VLMVYALLKKFPKEEQYALCDQLRRSAISVCSNVAEGSSRSSKREFAHYIEISYGSLMEAQSQLELSQMLGYISDYDLKEIEVHTDEIARMLSGLRSSLTGK